MTNDETLERALALHQDGQLTAAAELYREVLQNAPDNADAFYLAGCLAYQTDNFGAARDLMRRAVALAGEQPEYHHALGVALSALQDQQNAAVSYQRAVDLDAGHVRALAGLGDALLELNRAGEAVVNYRRALQIDGSLDRVWYGCGCAENARGEFAAARDCFERAVELQPDWLEARHNWGRALYELGLVSEAFAQFQFCVEMDRTGSEHSRAMSAVVVPGVPGAGNGEILRVRKAWAERDLPVAAKPVKGIGGHAPLRVGYVSSFFQRDNWMKPVWGLINQHDRKAVKLYLFSDCAAAAIQHGYLSHPEDSYFDISGVSNAEVLSQMRRLEVDVLVDLNGYSNMKRLPLFAERTAAVVMGWFNMYATTGMGSFDYLVGDSEVIPVEEEQFYTEQILRVSGSYLTFDVNYPVPPVGIRPETGEFVFGALASQYKITDEVIGAWSRILLKCPGSSLLIKNKQMASLSGREFLMGRFEKYGIDGGRLRLEGPESHFEFLKAYDRMDVALDTFPYNGGTTTTEAIWQGVPVVTFLGDRWASRTSASILRAGGLSEFVASDLDGYLELAVRAFADRARAAALRSGMRERLKQSSVCDTAGFARQMEALYAAAVRAGNQVR